MALFLSGSILTQRSAQTNNWRPVIGDDFLSASTSHGSGTRTRELPFRFLNQLQSINSTQNLNQPIQVGAWGDDASVGNMGVQVEIKTNIYDVSAQQDNAFWVGDVLSDGSFVQFGYLIVPAGYYCLDAHITESGIACSGAGDNIGFSDARWFWAYFPDAGQVGDWYYGIGPANSAGANSTWHLYSISPSASNDWSFMMDGVAVYSSNVPSTISTSPVHLVAEKASGSYLSRLGPVEFRNLAYLAIDGLWHATSSLTLIEACRATDNDPCSVSGDYGVESAGPNDVIAGSNVSMSGPDQLVWQRQSTCTLELKLSALGTVGNAPLIVTFIDSVSAPHGTFRTDWWFGDGSHEAGNSNQTITYRTPGNYTPLVRVLDSAGCLSEASEEVFVAAGNGSTFGTTTTGMSSFSAGIFVLCTVWPRNAYAPTD